MKRAFLGTLWVGSVAAGIALALSFSHWLTARLAALDKALGILPNDNLTFGNCLLIIGLAFAFAWIMHETSGVGRRTVIFLLGTAELVGAAWILSRLGFAFSPWPAIVAVLAATVLALVARIAGPVRQRRLVRQIFTGRLAQQGHDRLTQNKKIDFSQPVVRTASFVFCEIANEPELIEELSAPDCAKLTREFIERASKHFLQAGGYLHAADGEGIRVLFGFPNESASHPVEAARSALAFRDQFRALTTDHPESLGKIDLRIGISSGTVVATLRDDRPGGELVIAGEPFEVARRLARANQIYGSEILLGPRTFTLAGKEILARPMDFLCNAEAHDRLEVYELLALAEKATPEEMARRDRFWTGVVYFRERRWNESFAEFNRARSEATEPDRPLQWYLRRLEPLRLKMSSDPAPITEPFAPLL
jgi:class 3 adenylate cyclase